MLFRSGSVSYLYEEGNTAYTSSGSPGGSGGGSGGGGGGSGSGGKQFDVGGMMGMFSRSSQTMQDMMKRLHPEGEKTARELFQKVNQGQDSQKLFDINKQTLNQGNPLDPSLYTGFGVSFLQ